MDSFFSADGFEVLFLLAVIVTAMFFRQRRQHALARDPKVVKAQLERLGADYTVLTNVVVSAELGMNDVSYVVVSPGGVFVLTVKTEAGKVFGKEGDREWQVKSGKQRDILYNPLWENRKHVNALEKLTGPAWFIPVVVFTRASLQGEFGATVIRMKELLPYIKQHKTPRLSPDKQGEISQKLRSTSRQR